MARKYRFQLSLKNGASVRTVEELREHFDLESVLGHFISGKLKTWLERAYCDDEAKAVGELTADMPDLAEKLCVILGVEYKADAESVDIEAIRKKEEKLRRLSSVTTEEEILGNIDRVAADQDELMELLAAAPGTIYLYGGRFSVPLVKKNIRFVGVDWPEVMLDKGRLIADYRAAGIEFQDVRYISPYRTEGERLYLDGRYKEALPLLEEAAGQGNPRARYIIAVCYRYGYGTLCSAQKSSEWLKRAFGMQEPLSSMRYAYWCCEDDEGKQSQILSKFTEELQALASSGDYLAQFEYWSYVILNSGKASAKDSAEAVEWFRRAAEEGNARAQLFLGWIYYSGKGAEQNYAKAVEWYRQAAEHGNVAARFNLGIMYENGEGVEQNYAEAVKWYRKAAEQGDAAAQFTLGLCYACGDGVPQDDAQAVKWYRKAAEQGYARAQCNLGFRYEFGHGVEQDYAEAVEWYRKAAEQGYARGQYNLGTMYEFGHGVEQDYAEAVKWYRQAAEQGHAGAQFLLGSCFYNGNGVKQDYAEAVEWYRKAAEQGDAQAQCYLGICYVRGEGVKQDYTEAVRWYRQAAEQGNVRAQRNLGVRYQNGEGVKQDYTEAVKWYRQAAEQGDAQAQYYLGICYVRGQGVKQDHEEAVKWWRKAAEQGDARAKAYLGGFTSKILYGIKSLF